MKKLKLSLVIALLGMVSIVGAQTASLSVKGGLNISNYYGDNLNDKSIKAGFHVGVGADLEFMPNIALQTGLFFSTKGAKYQYDAGIAGNVEYNVTANYLQLPLHLAYKIDVTPGTKVVLHAGPYIAYGVGGKRKIDSKFTDDLKPILGEQEVDTFDKDWGYKPFDSGVGIGIGAEFGLIIVDLGWDMGLTNISRMDSGNVKNQSAYLSLGYKF
ncbi:MAG: porin family protein [Dysgonamonadaceae bacterium]|nr:porin family protein [Dysgonamonadaceae bacterium]MDD3728357.1 porin family protein [Dysgonamonadaceae bacterium]MDD4247115.1 porin family protein [Dysgonamonadaceae bacterium]MDD4605700.1 porin family protein [Dysgonamonadaceae bacterium]